MHGDFTAAVAKLEELGFRRRPAAMHILKLPGPFTFEALLKAIPTAAPFAVEDAPNAGNLAAWHIQLCRDGSLEAAAEVFRRGIDLVNRLAEVT